MKKLINFIAFQPPARFCALNFEGDNVKKFIEKLILEKSWIHGCFFVVNQYVINLINVVLESWEQDILTQVALKGGINELKHSRFWHSIETLRDENYLEELWENNNDYCKLWLKSNEKYSYG